MGVLVRFVFGLALACKATLGFAVIETYEFESPDLQQRYQHFTAVLRCPKCQNQNLADSNSPIAEDLRREVHRLLHEGRSDDEIVEFMVSRYGEFILYNPPVNKHTVVLWVLPAGLLTLGGLIVIVLVYRSRNAGNVPAESTSQVHERARELLDGLDKVGEDKPQ